MSDFTECFFKHKLLISPNEIGIVAKKKTKLHSTGVSLMKPKILDFVVIPFELAPYQAIEEDHEDGFLSSREY